MRIAPGEIIFAAAGLAVLPELLGAKTEEPLAVANDDPAPAKPGDDGFSTVSGPDDESDIIATVSEPTEQMLNAMAAQSQAPPRLSEETDGLLEAAFSDESLATALLMATATQPVEATAPPAVVEIPSVKIPPIRNPSGGGGGGSGPQGTGGGGGGGGGGQGESSQSLFAGPGEGVITLRGGSSGSQTLSEGESYVAAEDDTGYEVSHGIGPLNGWSVAINDFVAGPEPTTVQLVSGPSNAQSFTFYADGSFDYMPTYGQIGVDSFVYQLSSGDASDTATAYITVYNIPPTGQDDSYGTIAGGTLEVTNAAEGLLSNDSDFDGIGNSHLSVADYTQPVDEYDQAVGSVTVNSNGTFSFTAPDDYIGTLTFDYWVADEFAQAPAPTKVTIAVEALQIHLNGHNITNTPVPYELMVGQKASLSLAFPAEGAFTDVSFTNIEWIIPGWAVEDVQYDDENGAVVDQLGPDDLALRYVTAHWINDGTHGVSVSAHVEATIPGTGITATADIQLASTVKVNRPDLGTIIQSLDFVHAWNSYSPPVMDLPPELRDLIFRDYYGEPVAQLGDWHDKETVQDIVPGIHVEIVQPLSAGTYFGWANIIRSRFTERHKANGTVEILQGQNELDRGYPTTTGLAFRDSPIQNLGFDSVYVQRQDVFDLHFLYSFTPPDTGTSVLVSVLQVTWYWEFTASSTNGISWTLDASDQHATPATLGEALPTWNGIKTSG